MKKLFLGLGLIGLLTSAVAKPYKCVVTDILDKDFKLVKKLPLNKDNILIMEYVKGAYIKDKSYTFPLKSKKDGIEFYQNSKGDLIAVKQLKPDFLKLIYSKPGSDINLGIYCLDEASIKK